MPCAARLKARNGSTENPRAFPAAPGPVIFVAQALPSQLKLAW